MVRGYSLLQRDGGVKVQIVFQGAIFTSINGPLQIEKGEGMLETAGNVSVPRNCSNCTSMEGAAKKRSRHYCGAYMCIVNDVFRCTNPHCTWTTKHGSDARCSCGKGDFEKVQFGIVTCVSCGLPVGRSVPAPDNHPLP
jgi:hypothetical protein